MLEIRFRDGGCVTWEDKKFTDYDFIGDWLVVLKSKQWGVFYRADDISYVEYVDDPVTEDGDSCKYD